MLGTLAELAAYIKRTIDPRVAPCFRPSLYASDLVYLVEK
jgi:hypothetical protein